LIWIEAGHLEKLDENGEDKGHSEEYASAWENLKSADGIVVPGGFGNRYVVIIAIAIPQQQPCTSLSHEYF
jgi:CTP synthase (UTP-ammonia lyase)